MIIKTLHLDSFAGMNNREVTFKTGLNVLLGPNEAGKSTLVDAIFMTLFRDTALGRNTKEYKEMTRYMPYPGGKAICTTLTASDGQRDFRIHKEWGSTPRTDLTLAGTLIREPAAIQKLLDELLVYGEGTYDKIVFAKQRGFQDVLERLAADPQAAGTLGGVLRKAVMELDGVSIEELRARIENTYNTLADHWDQSAQRPEGNRGIHNPWKTKVGKVLEKYYEKEQLKYDLTEARNTEDRYTAAANALKAKTALEKQLNEELRNLSALENDMVKRASLEVQWTALLKDISRQKQICLDLPVVRDRLQKGAQEKVRLAAELQTLEDELKQAEMLAAVAVDADILQKAADLEAKIIQAERSIQQISQYTDQVVQELQMWLRQQREAAVAMEAARLKGKYLAGTLALQMQDGLGQLHSVQPGEEFSADGYFKLQMGDDWVMEIASGEINYRDLIAKHQESQNRIAEILTKLPAESVEDALDKNQDLNEQIRQMENLQRALVDLLKGRDRHAMQQNVNQIQGISTRPRAELSRLRDETLRAINLLDANHKHDAQAIQQWEREFGDLDNLFDQVIANSIALQTTEADISKLPNLPPEFKDVGEFKSRLEQCRKEAAAAAGDLDQMRSTYYSVKEELARMDSPEELAVRLADADHAFTREKANLEHMGQVRDAFMATVASMGQNTMDPLINAFGNYLSLLTDGRYSTGQIQETLSVAVTRKDGTSLPVALLSMGTYDCVSLAFRLAILDHLYVENPGLLVLDDCLVNMDEKRRRQAVSLIQAFSQKNQVIFSTCNTEVAQVLGGNTIRV